VKSPTMARTRKAPALSKALQHGPGSVGGVRTAPLTADAGRILAVCWRTATVTTETNVPPKGHALGKAARTAPACWADGSRATTGTVALCDPCTASVRDLDVLRSDCQCEVVEDLPELVVVVDVGDDVVVAAAHILHEGMTGGEDPH
jgi:hypothetical protein